MKTITQKISGIIAIIAMFATAVSAYAWTSPATPPPNQGSTFPPLHTGAQYQVKAGDLGVDDLFANTMHSGIYTDSGASWLTNTFFTAGNFNGFTLKGLAVKNDGDSYFFDGTILPNPSGSRTLNVDANGKIVAGAPASGQNGALPPGTVNQTLRHDGTNWVASSRMINTGLNVGINLDGLSNQNNGLGRDALYLYSDTPQETATNIVINTPNFGVWSQAANKWANYRANKIQLAEGAAQGSVLTSSDAAGNAVWTPTKTVKMVDTDQVKVYRVSWYNDNNTRIHDGFASCEPGYVAISGGVDCQMNDQFMSDNANMTRKISRVVHAVQISEPAISSGAKYPYTGSGSGNATTSTSMPTAWHGMCGDGENGPNASALDMHITVTCVKTETALAMASTQTSGLGGHGIPTGGGNSGSGKTWHTMTGQGAANQTCNAWLAQNTNYTSNPRNNIGKATWSHAVGGSNPIELSGYADVHVGMTSSTYDPTYFSTTCAYSFTNTYSLHGSGNGGLAVDGNFKSKCHLMPATFSDPNARPVGSCSDNAAVFTPTTGGASQLFGTGMAAQTQLYY